MTAFVNLTQQSIVFSDRRRLAEIPLAVEYSQAIRDLLRTIISATMPRLAGMVASFVYFYFLFGTSLVMIAVLALFVLLVGTAKLEHWKCQSWSSLSDAKQEHLRKARGFLGIWHASLVRGNRIM
jgi:ABC-type transport system involved in Fe-S cluster assembly fused permease/ATPase subunit